jgi:hypothetical protein
MCETLGSTPPVEKKKNIGRNFIYEATEVTQVKILEHKLSDREDR